MTEIDLTKKKFSNDRAKFRKQIINIFLDEKAGTGKGENTTRYKYVVRVLYDGRKIYLRRQANINNGIDFTNNVENTNFNLGDINNKNKTKIASTRPTHENILTNLKTKKAEKIKLYNNLIDQVDLIY